MKINSVVASLALCLAVSPMAASAVLAQTARPAGYVDFQSAQKAGEVMTNRLGGTRVFNAKGDVIGQINDVVIDSAGQAKTVVIGLGGFLGIGSKLVAVPFSAVKVGPVVESQRVVLLDVTKEQLEAAPAYRAEDPGKADRAKQKAGEWAKIAKQKAIELGSQAGKAIEGMREKMSTPAPGTPAPSTPAPSIPAPSAPVEAK